MPELRVAGSIAEIGRGPWDALFPGELETYDYLLAVESAGLPGFDWRYPVVVEDGRVLAAAAAFITDYALETTLEGSGRKIAAAIRRVAPDALTLRLACLGSPCTETAPVGFAPEVPTDRRPAMLRSLLDGLAEFAARERCSLLGVKDVPQDAQPLWDRVARPLGYAAVPGLPLAHLDIDFPTLEAYLGRLSPGTRKDMRRKLRALERTRIEIRADLDGVADRVTDLYRETRARADMQFEDLTRAFFTGVAAGMPGRALYVLYYDADDLVAVNLLLQDQGVLLDKFFCMEAARGRRLNLYFLSWFTNVRLCLERGLSRYHSGQAGYENKLRLGSALTRTSMYFRHRNPVVNRALQVVAPLFAADPTLVDAA